MTSQPVEANVVLTADNSQYDMAMDQSAQSTNQLAKSVDSLGSKINSLTKSAGKKLLGISAADVAVIGGATAAWASYEKQMSKLQAQAAITTRSREAEQKSLKSYTESVRGLRKEFGTTTTEAAELTQQISKMADQTRSVKDLAHTFEEMSHATGESSTGLANSLLNLQKIMGTPQAQTKAYADQLTYLAANSNTTATALADFSSQIAPLGRAMGMTQTQVTGFSNMFIKAGQDGYTAATAFNKVAQDITQAVQTGSPDMAKYANVLGVTVDQFKNMSGAEQVAGFLDQISRLGPKAAQELNRFGFDGIRMSKSITAAVQSSGGAMNAIREAQVGYGSNATEEGSKAAQSMTDTLAKLRQELQMTAEAFGKAFGPGIGLVLKGIEKVAGAFETLMEGPLGKFIQIASAVILPVTAIAGAFALMAGAIAKAGLAFLAFRNSAALGLREGIRGGARIAHETGPTGVRTGGFVAHGSMTAADEATGRSAFLGTRGAQIAEKGSWYQRGLYNTGQTIGMGTRGLYQGIAGSKPFTAGPGGEMAPAARVTAGAIRFVGQGIAMSNDHTRFTDPTMRNVMLGQHFPGMKPDMAEQVMKASAAEADAHAKLKSAEGVHQSVMGARAFGASGPTQDAAEKASHEKVESAKKEVAAAEKASKATAARAAGEVKAAAQSSMAAKEQLGVSATLRAETANVTRSFAAAAVGVGKFAASATLSAGKGLMNALGGGWGLAITGAMMAPMLIPMIKGWFKDDSPYEFKDMSGAGSEYMKAAGVTPITGETPGAEAAAPTTRTQALRITPQSIAAAKASTHRLSDPKLYGLSEDETTAYLSTTYSQYKKSPAALEQLKLDLIDKFGEDRAQRVLINLEAGNATLTPDQLLAQADSSSGDDRTRQLNLAAGMYVDQANVAYGRHGEQGFASKQAHGIAQLAYGSMANKEGYASALKESYGLDIGAGIKKYRDMFSQQGQINPFEAGLATNDDATTLQALIEQLPQEDSEALRGKLGIPLDVTGSSLTTAINSVLSGGGKAPTTSAGSILNRISKTGPTGQMFAHDKSVQTALMYGAQNVGANVEAMNSMFDKMRDLGKTSPQITKAMGDIQSTIGDPTDPNYILAGYISGQAQQTLAQQMPLMTRAQQFQTQVDQFQHTAAIDPTTPDLLQQRQDAMAQMASSMAEQKQYFSQMLIMQEQFERSRERAETDYNLQRKYAEHDFNLGRSRAEYQFELQRKRGTADYYRGIRRANYDYNLQRQRAEDDFNHQVEVNAKQSAQSVYDIYQRVQAQRTSSADWILTNAQDQLVRMREQEENLDRLRQKGLSDTAIQQLKLTDPQNADQLARFVTEITPAMIRQFNKVAGDQRVKAAKDLFTDPSSLEWQETRRGFRLSMDRMEEDFRHTLEMGSRDFHRVMSQQKTDFDLMQTQQLDDYTRNMNRQEHAYNTQMKRAAEDFNNIAKEIDLSYEQVLTQSVDKLQGHAKKQAQAALASFRDLKNQTSPEAVDLMRQLSDIFGFDYQPPKGWNKGNHDHGPREPGDVRPTNTGLGPGAADGAVMPGWTPGRDVMHIPVSGGEAIMRPEWTRAVGEKTIEAWNHKAKYGGFKDGGVYWPVPGHDTSTYPGHDGVDINRGSGSDDLGDPIRAFRSGTIVYVGSGHGYGDAIFEKTAAGTVVYGHTSAQSVHAGQRVQAGQLIGNVGATGHASAPHLHFGIPGGTYAQAMALLAGAIVGGGGFGGSTDLSALLKDRYPKAERAAGRMQGVNPLRPGQISEVINRLAHRKIRQLREKYGSVGVSGGGIGREPSENLSNEQIVHTGANRMGWGDQWGALRNLVSHESGFNNRAQNPTSTAYGMFQFLDGTWAGVGGHKTSDPWLQTQYGLKYIKQRYNDPHGAWDFWQDHNWYKDGSVFTGPQTIGVGEQGPEAVIPLNARGSDFMAEVMGNVMGGRNVAPTGGGMSVYNTRIDRSTNFSGPITVQANDPQELIKKLQARQRVMALSRPSLTGSVA